MLSRTSGRRIAHICKFWAGVGRLIKPVAGRPDSAARIRRQPGRPSQSRSVIATTERRLAAVGHSLAASCMHTASDVFVILKARRCAAGPDRPLRKSVAVDNRSVPR
jgi:hypothetical protein